MSGRGPLVPKSAHRGAVLYLVATVQFIVAMAITQAGFSGYSDISNAISDLGNHTISRWWFVFDGSIILFGLLLLGATWLVRSAFRPRTVSYLGLGTIALAALTSIGVGVFPEGSPHDLHPIFSDVTFLAAGVALLLLAVAMMRDTRWDGMRLYSAISGVVVLAAAFALSSRLAQAWDFGAIERVVVAPALLWLIVASVHLLRIPAYDPMTPWPGPDAS